MVCFFPFISRPSPPGRSEWGREMKGKKRRPPPVDVWPSGSSLHSSQAPARRIHRSPALPASRLREPCATIAMPSGYWSPQRAFHDYRRSQLACPSPVRTRSYTILARQHTRSPRFVSASKYQRSSLFGGRQTVVRSAPPIPPATAATTPTATRCPKSASLRSQHIGVAHVPNDRAPGGAIPVIRNVAPCSLPTRSRDRISALTPACSGFTTTPQPLPRGETLRFAHLQ